MSEPDGFLTRWSRRKREAAKAGDPSTGAGLPHEGMQEPAKQPDPPETPDSPPEVDPASLPPIESIEAATDIRAFLAQGVAPDLANAALRRAWLADPAIRDFVGLADYAWDFNAPDAMAGFGPLRATDDVRQLLSQMIGNEASGSPPQPGDPAAVPGAGTSQSIEQPLVDPDTARANCPVGDNGPPASDDAATPPRSSDVAMQDSDATGGEENRARQSRQRHGSALPE